MITTRLSFLIGLLFLLPKITAAQGDCHQWPAPCPHSTEISEAMDITSREDGNTVTQQEITMEGNLRNAFTAILQKFARTNHWQLYELMESAYDRPNGAISFAQWRATHYEKRPPHLYSISFIIIVNKDSLQAWQDWYNNDLFKKANQVVADIKTDGQNESNDVEIKALTDSVEYYAELSGKYTQDHYAQYMSDIQSNNQKGIKKYNDQIEKYTERSDEFIKKMKSHANAGLSSTGSYNSFEAEKISKTAAFTNAAVILVNFTVNAERTGFGLTDANQQCLIPQKTLTVPGAFYAGLLHNPSPPDGQSYYLGEHDFVFDHPSNIGTVLFGKWQSKRDAYNYTLAAYTANKAADDIITIKNIKCDAVQNIVIQAEGRPDYINRFLTGADMNVLQKLVTQ